MRWKSSSSIDSASSVRVGVSGEHATTDATLQERLQALAVSYRGKTSPGNYCIEEFANDSRLIDTMFGSITKSL